MKAVITTSKAVAEGLFYWCIVFLFGAILNWIGFSYYLTEESGFFFWVLVSLLLYIIFPLAYLYFGFFYAQRVVFRRFYQDNSQLSQGISKFIMKHVIKLVNKEGHLSKDSLELKKIMDEYLKKWPWLVRISLKTFLFFIPLWDMIKDLDKNKLTEENHELISQDLQVKMDFFIKEELLSRFPWFTLWLAPINILVMYLVLLTG